jgi:hypothetical protein
MANPLKIQVENPDDLLNAGVYGTGALIQIQSATTHGGAYADLTGTGSTPTIAIVSATYAYSGYDPNGASTTWYRTRYKNAAGSLTSDWSDEFQANGVGYCSLYDVKQRLGRTALTDTADDENFADLIVTASDYIKGYTGRDFLPDYNTILTFDGYDAIHGGRCLLIPRGVRSLSLVEAAAYTGASFVTIPSTDHFLRPAAHERTPGWPATELWLTDQPSSATSQFMAGYGTVRLTGTFGFAAVPPRIEEVCLNMVVKMWASRQAGQADLTGAGDSASSTYSPSLSRRDAMTLDLHSLRLPVAV